MTPSSHAPGAPEKSATIHEIAKAAGVSIASVSRALNGKPGISAKRREHILAISREIHYQPSAAARQLISGKQAVVGISMGRQNIELRPYYALLYQHLTRVLHRKGRVPISFRHDATATLPERAGSAILLGCFPDDPRPRLLTEQGVAHVRIGQPGEGFSVMPDDCHGIYLATRHMIERGRTRIAYLGDDLEAAASRSAEHRRKLGDAGLYQRIEGYRQALAESGLAECLIGVPSDHDPTLAGYRRINRLLQRGEATLDGLVCEKDELAVGALAAFEDHDIAVPGQVAVTGFDDLPLLAAQLTTVRQDIALIASETVRLLDEAIGGAKPHHVSLPTTLIQRRTT